MLALGLLVAGTAGAVSAQNAYAEDLSEATAETELPAPQDGPRFFDENVTRTVEDIDNGVIITLTTDDADTLEKLQNPPADDQDKGPLADEVTREITLLENGIQITLTSDDETVVEKLQNMEDHPHMGPMEQMNIDRTVENTENGVVVTLTSDDPDTVTFLQERAQDGFSFGGPHHGGPRPEDMDSENDTDDSAQE